MPRGKYDPTVNVGDTRCRIHAVAGRHTLDQPSSLNFSEEEIIKAPVTDAEGVTTLVERSLRKTRNVRLTYDPSQPLPLRHPDTDELVGEMPMPQAFMVIYSLGRLAQLEDDERQAQAAAEAAAAAAQAEAEAEAAAAAAAAAQGVEITPEDLENPIPEGED